MLQQGYFNFAQFHPEPAGLNLTVRATEEIQIAVFPPTRKVSTPITASTGLAIRIGNKLLRC